MNIKRLTQDFVFIKEAKVESSTIIVADSKIAACWLVTHVGPQVKDVAPGDLILISRGQVGEHRVGDTTYKVIRESDIQAYVE